MTMVFIKRNMILVTGLVAALVMGLVLGITIVGSDSEIEQKQAQMSQLETELSEAEDARVAQAEEVSDSLLGVDSDRMVADDEVIEGFLDAALTWTSHEEYMAARSTVQRKYGLAEDSSFMTAFLPDGSLISKKDRTGKQYNLIDELGLTSQVGSYHTSVLKVEGTLYRYFIEVNVQGKSADGEGASTLPSLVMLTVDENGTITDVEASATTEKPRSSS